MVFDFLEHLCRLKGQQAPPDQGNFDTASFKARVVGWLRWKLAKDTGTQSTASGARGGSATPFLFDLVCRRANVNEVVSQNLRDSSREKGRISRWTKLAAEEWVPPIVPRDKQRC